MEAKDMLTLGVKSDILAMILDDRKTVEGRLAKGKFLTIHPGDTIRIREDFYEHGVITHSIEDRARVLVKSVRHFSSFAEMLQSLGYHNAIPDAASLSGAIERYRQFYSIEDEEQNGVVALQFHVASEAEGQ